MENHKEIPFEIKRVYYLCDTKEGVRRGFNGIGTVIHYPIPPHKQNAYKELNYLSLPITEQIHREVISLPISPVQAIEQAQYVIHIINKF